MSTWRNFKHICSKRVHSSTIYNRKFYGQPCKHVIHCKLLMLCRSLRRHLTGTSVTYCRKFPVFRTFNSMATLVVDDSSNFTWWTYHLFLSTIAWESAAKLFLKTLVGWQSTDFLDRFLYQFLLFPLLLLSPLYSICSILSAWLQLARTPLSRIKFSVHLWL